MKRELYREYFDRAAFPVVAADESGIIAYKNLSAGKYLPALRRGADIVRRLHGQKPLCEGMEAEVIGDTPYRRAVVLRDDTQYVFLFLSRLQYPDGDEEAKNLIENRGPVLDRFLAAAKPPSWESEAQPFRQSRVYTDLLGVCAEKADSGAGVYDVSELLCRLSSKLKGAFRSLGYRITMNVHTDTADRRYGKLNLYDFIFIFSRFLYIQMKLSDNGLLDIDAQYDEIGEVYTLRFSARTALTQRKLKGARALPFLCGLAPECALEWRLFDSIELLSENTHIAVDKYGKFLIEYRLSLIENASCLHVRSIEFVHTELDSVIEKMLFGIRKEIKSREPASR